MTAFSSLGTSFTATQSPTLGSFELDQRASWMHLPETCARSSPSVVQTRKKCLSSTATRAGTRPLACWGANCWLSSAIQPSFVSSIVGCCLDHLDHFLWVKQPMIPAQLFVVR